MEETVTEESRDLVTQPHTHGILNGAQQANEQMFR